MPNSDIKHSLLTESLQCGHGVLYIVSNFMAAYGEWGTRLLTTGQTDQQR